MRTTVILGALVALFVWFWLGLPIDNERQIKLAQDQAALDQLIAKLVEEPAAPKISSSKPQIWFDISDGSFEKLSEKWRHGIHWLVSTGRCNAYDAIIGQTVGENHYWFLLLKAQMMVESNCNANAVGGGTDYGLFQVQRGACTDVGISGDLLDPIINMTCALAYHNWLCENFRLCALTELFVGYNAGPGGAKEIENKRAFVYARKIDFAVRVLLDENA